MRYQAMRFSIFFSAPFLYLKMYLEKGKMKPSEYFYICMSKKYSGYLKNTLLLIILGIAARSYDAAMALRAVKAFDSSIPWWVLSSRDFRLLLEASLWLESEEEFTSVTREVYRKAKSSENFRCILNSYEEFALYESQSAGLTIGQPVLPGLLWCKIADVFFRRGDVFKSADALYQALRFVPLHDSRRSEVVNRLNHLDAIAGESF